MAGNSGIFGIPHGILSSTDEMVALLIGIFALVVAVFYDGDLDLRPMLGAAVVGFGVAILGSAVAPPIITNEWHISVVAVLVVIGGILLARRRAG